MSNLSDKNKLEFFETPTELTDELIDLCNRFCDVEITEILDPCVGKGKMLHHILKKLNKPYLAYDIEDRISDLDEPVQACLEVNIEDFLKSKLEYKQGRITFMNPPFTRGLKFVYKALEVGDWCFCILSMSSIINLDYSKVWALEIQTWSRYDFEGENELKEKVNTNVSISLMALRLKREGEKYEYEI